MEGPLRTLFQGVTRLTVKAKLTAMVLMSFVSLVVVGLSGGIGVKRIGDALTLMGEQSIPSVMRLTELRMWQLESLLVNREAATWSPEQYDDQANKDDALSEAGSIFDSILERRQQADAKVLAAIAAYEQLPKSPSEQARWDTVRQERTEFAQAYELMLKLLKNMAHAKNWQSLTTDFAQFKVIEARVSTLWEALEKDLDACLEETRAGAQAAQASGQQTVTGATTIITLVFVVAMGLLALMAMVIAQSVVGAFGKMQEAVTHVAESNDFRRRIDWSSTDEAGKTVAAFNHLLENVHGFLRTVLEDAKHINDGANQAAEAADKVSSASGQQAEAVKAMAASTERMTTSIEQISESARSSLNHAQHSGAAADEGGGIIADMVGEMDSITSTVGLASSSIHELGRQSERISVVIQVIKEVAEQTNLLALNAAIEAARAGENGRGFAVVADEVRKLSERTAGATQEIGAMVTSMQAQAREATRDMDLVVRKVGEGKALSSQAASCIDVIRTNANRVVEAVSEISRALKEQSLATKEMAGKVDGVAGTSDDNSTAATRTAEVANALRGLAESLRAAVSQFHV